MPSLVSLEPSVRRWVQRSQLAETADVLSALESALKLPQPLCRLLLRRGFGEPDAAKSFLKPRLDQLLDPFTLAGMLEAVARIELAITRNEIILAHGDYDVDGICAAGIFTRVLRRLGARVEPFVPHRLHDGYDLSQAGVRAAVARGATLILSGDCGIVAHDAIAAAKQVGIDVIVTDHHTPGDTLPPAVAVVNPNRADCPYENKGLCGAGVAFKVCQALWQRRGLDPQELWYYLDLVAIATIADLAPLTGENRVITRYGLRLLPQSHNPGLRALLATAGLSGVAHVNAGQVSHVLAPRINAVGRMSAAAKGVALLLEENEQVAHQLATTLEEENRTRQTVDRDTLQQALEMLEQDYDPGRDYVIVLGGRGWHPGVIGIVASRVVERLHRPTILFSLEEGVPLARGSARSIPGFHLYDALKECASFLERFGGHKYAAGMDIRPERIADFRASLCAVAHQRLTPEDLIPEINCDLEVRLADANLDLVRLLRHFGPFGVGNPTPVFVAREVRLSGPPREVGEGHIKLDMVQDKARFSAIGFGMADRFREQDLTSGSLDVAFQLQENFWNGYVELQARLVDVRHSGCA
jgi:single-stranded-DNA-specific exonuclease